MAKEYIIKCRYEYRASDGIRWTTWYVVNANHIPEDAIDEALKKCYESSANTDKKTKLRHEYMKYDADEYEKEYKQMLEDIEIAKKEFAAIPRMKKPWKKKKKS